MMRIDGGFLGFCVEEMASQGVKSEKVDAQETVVRCERFVSASSVTEVALEDD